MHLARPLTLACGLVLPNRLAKASMTEQLAPTGDPDGRLRRLYARFAAGGAGLVLTGNVMIHRDHREHRRNVVVDERTDSAALRRWATEAGGAPLVAQLSHPGRQALYAPNGSVAPSAVALNLGPVFKPPRALAVEEIGDVVRRFASASRALDDAGFAGVQVHGAHGYLVSQFLSPLVNKRDDAYGGTLERRARFLLETIDAIRGAVRPGFAVMLKLNSADFQRGGFDDDDALAVMGMLEGHGVDLLEVSGGSYEAPAMVGDMKASTRAREAYFLDFAERAKGATGIPLMVTGGFRTPAAMEQAVASGAVDVVGLARPLAMEPDLPRRVLAGDTAPAKQGRDRVGVRALDSVLAASTYVEQMHRVADGKEPDVGLSRAWTLAHAVWMSRG